MGKISKYELKIYDHNLKEIRKEMQTFDLDLENAMKNGYDHFMLKEINEEDIVINNLLNKYNTK